MTPFLSNLPVRSRAILFVLRHEGGYANDPSDPGGETKYGISKKAYPDLDIKKLTVEDVHRIYVRDYWQRLSCDEMTPPVGLTVFDSAVNCGRDRASKWLQTSARALDCPVKLDGIIGPKTLAAVHECDPARLCLTFLHQRLFHYLCLGKKYPQYVSGWVGRTSDLMREIADI